MANRNLFMQRFWPVQEFDEVSDTPTISQLGKGESTLDNASIPAGSYIRAKKTPFPNILIGAYDPSLTLALGACGDVAISRKDCMAILSVGEKGESVSDVVEHMENNTLNTSYVSYYSGWQLHGDSYTDKRLYIPLACYVPAIYARTDNMGNVWDAPAGMSRGVVRSQGQFSAFSEKRDWFVIQCKHKYDKTSSWLW